MIRSSHAIAILAFACFFAVVSPDEVLHRKSDGGEMEVSIKEPNIHGFATDDHFNIQIKVNNQIPNNKNQSTNSLKVCQLSIFQFDLIGCSILISR